MVRYIKGGDNRILRLVLHLAWKTICYRCNTPKDFTDIQIDHILPSSWSDEKRADHLARLLIDCDPTKFDVNGPENLAPICGRCNNGKRDRDLPAVYSEFLEEAAKKRAKVIDDVVNFPASSNLAKTLSELIEADLQTPKARKVVTDYAGALVQKIALVAPEVAADYRTADTITVPNPERPLPWNVGLSLDAEGRHAHHVLTQLCRADLTELLLEPVLELYRECAQEAHAALTMPVPAGESAVSLADGEVDMTVETIQVARDSTTFLFSFSGHSTTQFPAIAVIPSEDGGGSEERQAYAEIAARFFFSFTWDAGCDEFEVSDSVLLSDIAIYTDIDGVPDMDDLLEALVDWDRDEEEPEDPSSA